MRHRYLLYILAALFIAAVPNGAGAQQTVELRNGDRLTGQLRSIDAGKWIFGYAGTELPLAADDITAFSAPEAIGIRLADGTILAASVTPVADGLSLGAPDGTSTTVAPTALAAVGDPENLEALRPVPVGLFSPFGRFWKATASLGASTKEGNTRTRDVTAFLEVSRETDRDRLTLTFQASRSNDRVRGGGLLKTAESFVGVLRGDIFTGRNWFVYASTRQGRDIFKDLDLRSFYTAGGGYQFIESDKSDLRSAGALGVRYENFTTGGTQTVVIASLNGTLRHALGAFEFRFSGDFTPTLDDLEDYQFLGLTSLTATVVKGLGFRIGLLYEFDNTPLPDREKSDAELTTTLTYTLGR